MRILVVDDEVMTREAEEAVLKLLGHEVVTAEEGGAALREVAKNGIDCVVTDLEMPRGMGGEVLTQQMHERYPDIPVILVTGAPEEAQKIPDCTVIAKPVRIEALMSAINQATIH